MEEPEKLEAIKKRLQSNASGREISPVNPRDPEELCELALRLTRSITVQAADFQRGEPLSHQDTRDIEYGSPSVDPTNPEFDAYKWARMFFRLSAEQGLGCRQAGFTFQNMTVRGTGPSVSFQHTVMSVARPFLKIRETFGPRSEKKIIRNFSGLVKRGELLIVLGRPGSGCSTLLKAITGELHNSHMSPNSIINYDGITYEQMHQNFRGEIIYNEEIDKHFPNLTVGETLEFAAGCRTPQNRFNGISRKEWITSVTQVAMTVLGLSHTYNTKVGNDFIHGVSGGERKRVSIAEVFLAGSPIVAWDNSTRGLDASTALKFVKSVRIVANLSLSCHAIAIYQASQRIYDEFDKATVLYEGRQIYFGPANIAKDYFQSMGWYCSPRQTTGDFLTSVTNPEERRARDGMETLVPRTPEEFEKYWQTSPEFAALQREILEHEQKFPIGGSKVLDDFKEGRKAMQSKHTRPGSSYTISIATQIKMCLVRAFTRIWHDRTSTLTTIFGMVILSLIIGSMFYNTPATTAGFSAKGGVLFFSILMNALISLVEINDLYDQRPIVEKHKSYAFYHPWTEALAGVLSNIVVKVITLVPFSIVIYFLSNLRAEPGPFFIFFLFNFVAALTMSIIFRTVAASTKTLPQAHTLAGVIVLAVIIYTGYIIPRPSMHPWFKWISWINPVAYSFESLLLNEMHHRKFPCASFVPPYPGLSGETFVCPYPGAVPGEGFVAGDAWLAASFRYTYSHLWRNLGFIAAFLLFFLALYLVVTEINSMNNDAGEVLVFRKGYAPKVVTSLTKISASPEESDENQIVVVDQEAQNNVFAHLSKKIDIFSWRDVTLDIKTKTGPRRLLDGVSGWVKPGTLTALMGVSGAGKTTLLNVLASRSSLGIIGGDFSVSGHSRDASFQRKIGYVQQQDLHLETSTVREALQFSALLRQPATVSRKEKYEYVQDIIKMLNMEDFAEAIVGVPGEGLNVHQRKLLTIGVELAAKPGLLLFLDEPTSGLDSQSSWSIISVLRKLADHGQPILSTIHQPSSTLFQEFDRLLLLGEGGKTVYFGDIGDNSETILRYFESHGARKCGPEDNVAEYALEVVGNPPPNMTLKNWHDLWNESEENKAVHMELEVFGKSGADNPLGLPRDIDGEFAMPLRDQITATTVRIFQQYWRTPSYIWGKILLGILSSLFVGFSFFQAKGSLQGIQNTIFAIFMITTIFVSLVNQILPRFIIQRSLYEERERPSKAYSWKAFLVANIVAEIPYHVLLGVLIFACFYYPVFGIQSSSRQGLILLYCIQFLIFGSTYAQFIVAAAPDSATAGIIATVLFALCLGFNGVFQPPNALPGFWLFMYRVSPLTYFVGGMASTTLHALPVVCSSDEIAVFRPPGNLTCGTYLQKYIELGAPGQLLNGSATTFCEWCSFRTADQVLAISEIQWGDRWRNFGILFSYIGFNIAACVGFYYVFRVKQWRLKRNQ